MATGRTMKVKDRYSAREFEALLDDAESSAESDWDTDFVNDMRDRYEEYGTEMFLSESQDRHMNRIAEGGS